MGLHDDSVTGFLYYLPLNSLFCVLFMTRNPDVNFLGLDICADIIVGDEMQRGISGGQKKRVTTGMSASCHFNMKERFAIYP